MEIYYTIDDKEYTEDQIDEIIERCCDFDYYYENCEDEDVENFIDECYDTVEIAGRTMSVSEIIKETDRYWFDEFKSDYANSQCENDKEYYEDRIKELIPGDTIEINNIEVECNVREKADDTEMKEEFMGLF